MIRVAKPAKGAQAAKIAGQLKRLLPRGICVEPEQCAKSAALRYITDDLPGIRRQRAGKSFRYVDAKGKPVRDKDTLARIKSLALPPAWTDVWISPVPTGHLQATGRDAKGRKQYRYHPRWRSVRDETKFSRMVLFAHALPKIRKRVARDMARRGLPREKVLATIVRLLEGTLIRVGNDEYARDNNSYGLTTMRDKHVKVRGSQVQFRFRGKSGKYHQIDVHDRHLAKIVKHCRDLPGQELFQYVDEAGTVQDVGSSDVNDYLRAITGEEFTAKDFRTWAGTVLAAMALQEFQEFDTNAQAKKNVVRAIESVSQRLGNTVAVCRKCYIHPAIIDSYLDRTMLVALKQRAEREMAHLHDLQPEEAAVLALLQERLRNEAKSLPGGNGAITARARRKTRAHRRVSKPAAA